MINTRVKRYFTRKTYMLDCYMGHLLHTLPPSQNEQHLLKAPSDPNDQRQWAIVMCEVAQRAFPPLQHGTYLASFPGSGNTWVRHLLQRLTGLYTGSVYRDWMLVQKNLLESVRDNSVVVVKTHRLEKRADIAQCYQTKTDKSSLNARDRQRAELAARLSRCMSRAVLLVRRPRDTVLAEFNRLLTRSHTMSVTQADFNVTEFNNFAREAGNKWYNFNVHWLNNTKYHFPLLVVRYEALQTSLKTELGRMLRFLAVRQRPRWECLRAEAEGAFHRRKDYDQLQFYDLETLQYLEMLEQQVDKLIELRMKDELEERLRFRNLR